MNKDNYKTKEIIGLVTLCPSKIVSIARTNSALSRRSQLTDSSMHVGGVIEVSFLSILQALAHSATSILKLPTSHLGI